MPVVAIPASAPSGSRAIDYGFAGNAASSDLRSYAFGHFVLAPARQLLVKSGTPVRIGGRALDILVALVERPGELIAKQDLVSRAWPDTFVDEANLEVNMASLRRALGESYATPQYIATVVGRGYRFVAPVQSLEVAPVPPSVEILSRRRGSRVCSRLSKPFGESWSKSAKPRKMSADTPLAAARQPVASRI